MARARATSQRPSRATPRRGPLDARAALAVSWSRRVLRCTPAWCIGAWWCVCEEGGRTWGWIMPPSCSSSAAATEPATEAEAAVGAVLSVALPWTADTVGEASKGELLAFLQTNCSPEFLRKHRLTGQAKTIKKKQKAPALQSVYREVLDDPSVLVPAAAQAAGDQASHQRAPDTQLKAGGWGEAPNYLPESEPGCHVARFDADWIVGVEPFDEADFGLPPGAELPDISIDPEEQLLSVINPSRTHARSVTISLSHVLRDAAGRALDAGAHRDATGVVSPCTTLVLLLRPRSLMDVCFVDVDCVEQVCIASDIKEVAMPLPSPVAFVSGELPLYNFPLPRSTGPYLCSQGAGGHFTHSFAETMYAVDIQCDVGTPVLAIAPATVKAIEQGRLGGGIHVTALYSWNSIMLGLDDGRFAEYVHIRGGSATVAVGDRVEEGQQLCESGDVGFCPTPHLHLQLHASVDDAAPTIPFAFRSATGGAEVPVAGEHCGGEGTASERCSPCRGSSNGSQVGKSDKS